MSFSVVEHTGARTENQPVIDLIYSATVRGNYFQVLVNLNIEWTFGYRICVVKRLEVTFKVFHRYRANIIQIYRYSM